MDPAERYALRASILAAAAVGSVALAMLAGVNLFAPDVPAALATAPAPATLSGNAPQSGSLPASHLAGTKFDPSEVLSVASPAEPDAADGEWVEVVDAVNMRSGPSRSHPVVGTQREGVKLRVASREAGWVEVAEPGSGEAGWVYQRFVRPMEPGSRLVELVGNGGG